ncbi:MAG: integration host factor subunit alpha [Thermodesulfobacteriota bacterium]
MTKADIVDTIFEQFGYSKKDVAEVVDTIFETLKETLEQQEKIKIAGFGNFAVRQKRARRGRNPQTGEEITIGPRKVMTFKASQILKSAINS